MSFTFWECICIFFNFFLKTQFLTDSGERVELIHSVVETQKLEDGIGDLKMGLRICKKSMRKQKELFVANVEILKV